MDDAVTFESSGGGGGGVAYSLPVIVDRTYYVYGRTLTCQCNPVVPVIPLGVKHYVEKERVGNGLTETEVWQEDMCVTELLECGCACVAEKLIDQRAASGSGADMDIGGAGAGTSTSTSGGIKSIMGVPNGHFLKAVADNKEFKPVIKEALTWLHYMMTEFLPKKKCSLSADGGVYIKRDDGTLVRLEAAISMKLNVMDAICALIVHQPSKKQGGAVDLQTADLAAIMGVDTPLSAGNEILGILFKASSARGGLMSFIQTLTSLFDGEYTRTVQPEYRLKTGFKPFYPVTSRGRCVRCPADHWDEDNASFNEVEVIRRGGGASGVVGRTMFSLPAESGGGGFVWLDGPSAKAGINTTGDGIFTTQLNAVYQTFIERLKGEEESQDCFDVRTLEGRVDIYVRARKMLMDPLRQAAAWNHTDNSIMQCVLGKHAIVPMNDNDDDDDDGGGGGGGTSAPAAKKKKAERIGKTQSVELESMVNWLMRLPVVGDGNCGYSAMLGSLRALPLATQRIKITHLRTKFEAFKLSQEVGASTKYNKYFIDWADGILNAISSFSELEWAQFRALLPPLFFGTLYGSSSVVDRLNILGTLLVSILRAAGSSEDEATQEARDQLPSDADMIKRMKALMDGAAGGTGGTGGTGGVDNAKRARKNTKQSHVDVLNTIQRYVSSAVEAVAGVGAAGASFSSAAELGSSSVEQQRCDLLLEFLRPWISNVENSGEWMHGGQLRLACTALGIPVVIFGKFQISAIFPLDDTYVTIATPSELGEDENMMKRVRAHISANGSTPAPALMIACNENASHWEAVVEYSVDPFTGMPKMPTSTTGGLTYFMRGCDPDVLSRSAGPPPIIISPSAATATDSNVIMSVASSSSNSSVIVI